MMKICCLLITAFILRAVASSEIAKRAKPPFKTTRPSCFASDVNGLLKGIAKENRYPNSKFDRCHVVPWQFLKDMIVKYQKKIISTTTMTKFINDLAQIHKSARFYKVLNSDTQTKLADLTTKYEKNAINALASRDMEELAKQLYNMPSNLYPGDPGNNRSIKDNFDAPKEDSGTGGRSTTASAVAKMLFATYGVKGLTKLDKPGDKTMAKTSDKPPGDTTGDYVTI